MTWVITRLCRDCVDQSCVDVCPAAHQTVADLGARGLQLQAELDELRRRLAELESASEENDDELGEAEDSRGEAEAALSAATRVRDVAQAALDRLP